MGKKWVTILLIAAFVVLVLFLVLREFGIFDANLYKSEVATDRTVMFAHTYPDQGDSSASYDVTLSYDGEPVSYLSVQVMGKPVLDVNVDVIPTISGNYRMPLYKTFTVEFSASFESSTPDGLYSVQGDIKGSTQMKIIGLCTSRKALELARDEIAGNVEAYLNEQLSSQGE